MKGKVILYGAPWCHACQSAKAWFASHGIEYAYIDVSTLEEQDSLGISTLPTVMYGHVRVTGFTPSEYLQVFGHLCHK